MKHYLITNGQLYIYKEGYKYKTTCNSAIADTFSYKQALGILNNSLPKKMKNYHLEEYESGQVIDINKEKKKAKEIISNKHIDLDESIIREITKDAESIMGLYCYDYKTLISKREILNPALSFYDMAISDITHIIGKKSPPAHIRTIIYGKQQEMIDKREEIKQTIKYIDIFIKSHTENLTLDKLQEELKKAKYVPYKGRTYIYDEIMELIG